MILLHRPFIEKDDIVNGNDTRNDDKRKLSSQSALTICTSAAIRIIEVSESMHYRDFLMVSWGFALYPVFTAALIHIHNSSNPDTIVSDVAKANLVRALAVVDKLCLLSPMATSMALVLKKVIALSSIFTDDPDFLKTVNLKKPMSSKEDLSSESFRKSTNSQTNASSVTNSPSDDKKIDNNAKKDDESTPTKGFKDIRNHWFPKNEYVDKKNTLDIQTPSWEDGSWINQLYTPTQPTFDMKGNSLSEILLLL